MNRDYQGAATHDDASKFRKRMQEREREAKREREAARQLVATPMPSNVISVQSRGRVVK